MNQECEEKTYRQKTANLLARVLRCSGLSRPRSGRDDIEREPSTKNPRDYVYVGDYRDIGKGRRVEFSTHTMPEEASKAFHLWKQGQTHEAVRHFIKPNAATFQRVMGFSPEALVQAQREKQKEIK